MKFNNTRAIINIAKLELHKMFYSPVAWLVLIIFAFQIGSSFSEQISQYIHHQHLGRNVSNLTEYMFMSMFGILPPIARNLYLYIPLITMGLMSREYQGGSIKLLYSSPIKVSSIILGKFLSMMIYGAVLISILGFITLFSVIFIKDFDYPMILTAMLGYYLLILAYSAIGLFMSSLTKYQVVAAISTLAVLAFLNMIGGIGSGVDGLREITAWFSIRGRSDSFLSGLISSSDLIYFILIIAFMLSLCMFKLYTQKVIMLKSKKILSYTLIIVGTFLLGYLSSNPYLKAYYDSTYRKSNTISVESQKILSKIKGNFRIITYVNILDNDYKFGLPQNRNSDRRRFEQYLRFKPGIKMDYVYYYDITYNPSLRAKFPNMTEKQIAEHICRVENLNFKKVLNAKLFKERYMDLSQEYNKFLRLIITEGKDSVILRTYNDQSKLASEAEISVSLKTLVEKKKKVGFSVDNSDRDIYNRSSRGYSAFANDKWFRQSLLNQGFTTQKINISEDGIPSDLDILVIADLNTPLSVDAINKVRKYIDGGGNLFILGEYTKTNNMNNILEILGLRFSDGLLVKESKHHPETLIAADFTEDASNRYIYYNGYNIAKKEVAMPTTLAINYSEVKDFSLTEVLRTKDKSWIEYETTDFIDGEFTVNEDIGEHMGIYTTLLNMERTINGKNQRITISGDSDFISNEELIKNRVGIDKRNYSVILGTFRWLSNDIYPIDTSHPDSIDDEIYLPNWSRKWLSIFFSFIFPISFLLFGGYTIYRRQLK